MFRRLIRSSLLIVTLVAASGGHLHRVGDAGKLDAAFAQIEQELRSQYAVALHPVDRDGHFHPLQVTVGGAGDVRVRARNGYWTPREFRP